MITTGRAGNSDYENFLKPYLDSSGQGLRLPALRLLRAERWATAAA